MQPERKRAGLDGLKLEHPDNRPVQITRLQYGHVLTTVGNPLPINKQDGCVEYTVEHGHLVAGKSNAGAGQAHHSLQAFCAHGGTNNLHGFGLHTWWRSFNVPNQADNGITSPDEITHLRFISSITLFAGYARPFGYGTMKYTGYYFVPGLCCRLYKYPAGATIGPYYCYAHRIPSCLGHDAAQRQPTDKIKGRLDGVD
jgi:hypothetical protein